jgi:hypothetical protein
MWAPRWPRRQVCSRRLSGQIHRVYWTKVQLDMTSTIRKIARRKRRNSNEHPIRLCLAAAMLLLDSCVERRRTFSMNSMKRSAGVDCERRQFLVTSRFRSQSPYFPMTSIGRRIHGPGAPTATSSPSTSSTKADISPPGNSLSAWSCGLRSGHCGADTFFSSPKGEP